MACAPASEIADLEWSQVEFGRAATLHVHRAKNGKASAHPLRGDEARALRELRRQSPDSDFVFATERSGPFTADAINRLIKHRRARPLRLSGSRPHAAPRLRLRPGERRP
jgi:type 1 fimbriae regulatory protein FimB/type 1 fimbriae regulatory protein FimE